MRRLSMVTVGTLATVIALALPSQAKGAGGEITITKSGGGATGGGGGGLNLPLMIRGEDSFMWFEATGMGQAKSGRPDVKLGPAYDVIATLDCGGEPGVIRQTLYPYANGGPQVFTAGGQRYCGEMPLRAGWWPAPLDLLATLESRGLEPPTADAAAGAVAGGTLSAANANGPSNPPLPILLAVGALLAMVAAGLIHRRNGAIRA